MKENYKDSVKDHCHLTSRYRGTTHDACHLKMRIKPKAEPIPVVFDILRGYGAHHLMQATLQLQKQVTFIAHNLEKYISFSVMGAAFH